ncbi:MAG TPA: hypothetical protein VFO73_15290 [Candidatus Limnocylindrales bacterium]|nr:hypothetical protein [Candidatus Limnocylindrales bacterium]
MDGNATMSALAVPLRLSRHLIVAAAIGLVTPLTGLAWPFAILTGMVIGRSEVDRQRGIPASTTTRAAQVLAVTGGVLAMLLFGAILGGLIAFVIVALAAFSERLAAGASPMDRTVARILVAIVAAVGYVVLALVLNLRVEFRFGG